MAGPEQSVCGRIVEAVADRSDADPLELPPLYDYVDPDALDAFVRGTADGVVAFRYAGDAVTVDSSGEVDVEEPHGAETAGESAVGDD
jgi:hypothetical protein